MSEPRQFFLSLTLRTPGQEITHRHEWDQQPCRERAIEVAPGVHVGIMSVGDIRLDGEPEFGHGAHIAVWDERGAIAPCAFETDSWDWDRERRHVEDTYGASNSDG